MKKHTFPEGFLWGTSTAAHQVEGNNFNSDWWYWEQQKEERPKSGIACDHYHLYKSDFALAKKLGHNAHRISIEWARIEPKEGKFDGKEIEHYRGVLKELKKLNLKSFVTLWHFSLPKWFADMGGFEKRENIKYFEKYVERCAKEYGDLINFWITINEPSNYTLKSYLVGWWPPQNKNFFTALKVYINSAEAHKQAQKVVHDILPSAKVGFSHQLVSYYPETNSIFDKLAGSIMSFFANDLFLLFAGRDHDFFGLNYYFHNPASFKYMFMKIPDEDLIKTLSDESLKYGWGMSAKGFYRVIKMAWRQKKPIYVLENGIADSEDGSRRQHLIDHLKEMAKAMEEGAEVKSYLHWSLMDNFEWQFGFDARFGLCETDYKTQKRIPRKSAKLFESVIKANAI